MASLIPSFPPPLHGLQTIWRDKSTLVMIKETPLPDRCVKCNEPAAETLKRKLTWHHPALYLTLFINILVYLVVVLVMRKTATVNIGLCENHLAARRRNLAITWGLGGLSLLCFLLGGVTESLTFLLLGFVLLLATAIFGTIVLRVVVPTRIDNHFVWLKGINPDYLREFPQWQGRAS